MSEHSLLSPSGASKWLACTPSVRLEQLFEDNAGTAAEEGTLAHALSELLIKRKLERVNFKDFNAQLDVLKTHPLYDREMLDICEEYSVYVMECYHEAQARTKDASIFTETMLDLTAYIPEGKGTGDINIISDDVLDFIDLKFGKGVKVNAYENKQLMIYGLGSYERYSMLYDIKRIRMTIYQPRLDHIDTFEMAVDDLLHWGREVLIPKAKLAFAGEGAYNPGEHCRFCRAKTTCKANAEFQLEMAKFEFKQADLLTDSEIADIYNRYDSFINWLKGVTNYALAEAIKGKEWPGLKLVEGKSVSKWTDHAEVANLLRTHGYENSELYKPAAFKGLGDIKKLIGKRDYDAWLVAGGFIYKPKGAPSLAPDSDPRPVYIPSATDDFKNLFEESESDD